MSGLASVLSRRVDKGATATCPPALAIIYGTVHQDLASAVNGY